MTSNKTKEKEILEIIGNTKITIEELENKIGKDVDIRYPLCQLIKKGKIKVSGIDENCKRIAQKYFLLEKGIVSYTYIDIQKLINNIITGGSSSDEYIELKQIFELKLEKKIKFEMGNWEEKLEEVKFRDFEEEELLILKALTELQPTKNMFKLAKIPPKEELIQYIKGLRSQNYEKILENLKMEYKNCQLWYFEKQGPFTLLDIPLVILKRDYIFKKGEMDKEKFLIIHAYEKPMKMTPIELNDLLNKTLYYISSKQEEQNKFALALSIEDNDIFFRNFIDNINRELNEIILEDAIKIINPNA